MKNHTRILFMGTPDFAVPSLSMLSKENYHIVGVITQPDRPKGRTRKLTPSPVKVASEKHQIPVYQPQRLRSLEGIRVVQDLQPDLIITAAYGQILPEEILNIPQYGCINVHASLLPKYRGGAPIHKAIMEGEKETGITIMYMVKALDAGDIIKQKAIPILPLDHVGTMHEKLSVLGAELLIDVVPRLIQGNIDSVPQDESQVTYAPNITRDDEIIDWSRSAEEIDCHIRGLHPWPVAYTLWDGKSFKIWWGEKKKEDTTAKPGTVIELVRSGIKVATGRGTIILTEVQPAGKKRMTGQEFIRGRQIKVGDRFGEEND